MGWWQRRPGAALLLATLALGPSLSLADSVEIERTNPSHLGPKTRDDIEPPAPAGHIYRKIDVLAYRFPEAVTKWAKYDPKLSHLCRLGAFRHRISVLCPGHGPLTTVGEEQEHNPFFA